MAHMEALLMTAVVLVAIVVGLVLLSRVWVHSSKLGGYHAARGADEPDRRPKVPEDDEERWRWDAGRRP